MPITLVDEQQVPKNKLSKFEMLARKEAAQSIRVASLSGGYNPSSAPITMGESSFYSAQMSTDFMEMPQSQKEKRELYKFWYNSHPIVGSAIDFHTDVPMSKIRLSLPKGKNTKKNKQILHYFERMSRDIRLFQTLYDITHEYWLNGNVFVFCEDHDITEEMPENLLSDEVEEEVVTKDYIGREEITKRTTKKAKPKDARKDAMSDYIQKNYQGWRRLQILPPEQVKLEVFQYTNKIKIDLIPAEKDKQIVQKAQVGNDAEAMRIAGDIPSDIRDNLMSGQPIPLATSPWDDYLCSSFCYHLAHKKAGYEDRGVSLLDRCLRTLIYQDKLRQAQTQIASRAMTPKRVVWADKISEIDAINLREQVEQALIDPDFTIVANYEVHWDEIGARDRLLDLGGEYEITNKLLYIGLRVTEAMLTGESSYSGERIHLDVMNTMYLLYRETITEFVEQQLFAPVAEKMGFYEDDEWGNRVLLFPKLQFTRLALRDNSELQDFMFNIYQKGSLPISFILELLNIDSDDALDQLKRDMFTPADSTFNEVLRAAYTKIGESIGEGKNSDIMGKVMDSMGLHSRDTEGDRFGSESLPSF